MSTEFPMFDDDRELGTGGQKIVPIYLLAVMLPQVLVQTTLPFSLLYASFIHVPGQNKDKN